MRSLKNKLFQEEKSPNTEHKKSFSSFREGNSRNKGIQKLKEASNSQDKQNGANLPVKHTRKRKPRNKKFKNKTPNRVEAIPNEVAEESPKQASPKQASPKQTSPKQVSPKQASPKQASPKQESPKQASPKRAEAAEASPKQAEEAEESPKKASPNRYQGLAYDMPVPVYDLKTDLKFRTNEPDFWKPLFPNGEMMELRNKIHQIMQKDCSLDGKGWKNEWDVCTAIQQMIPSYFVPRTGKVYTKPSGFIVSESPTDFSNFNVILCMAFLVYGIISHRMSEKKEAYQLVLKGGKAIQIVLSETEVPPIYESEDIDILLLPKRGYDREEIKRLSGHLAYLMKWFLEIPLLEKMVSVLDPDDPISRNPDVYKLSYHNMAAHSFRAFSDIDFKELPKEGKKYYTHLMDFHQEVPILKEEMTFHCPTLDLLLDEKIYYYSKFFIMCYLENKEGYSLDDCIHFQGKFRRAILALNKAMQTQKYPRSSPQDVYLREVDFLRKRLNKIELYGIGVPLIVGLFRQNGHIPGIDPYRRGNRDIQFAKEHIIFLISRSLYP